MPFQLERLARAARRTRPEGASGNQITVTDALGHTATTQYDALDRATTMISATSGVTTITFDAAARETSLTDPVGNKTQWAYDADDRVTTVTEPNGQTVTYVYDNDAELVDMTDADGRRTTYSHNADGDQTGETWVGASPAEKITYGLGMRRDCAFQPMLMRRELLSGGLLAEEFVD